MKTIERRLSRLEVEDGMKGVSDLIGRNYDELSQCERERWAKYRFNADASAVSEVFFAVCGSLHFPCDKRPKKPTKSELARAALEIESAVLGV